MLDFEGDQSEIDGEMRDFNLAHIESESEHIQIAEARLAAMQDGESEIGKLNYITEMDASLKYFRS
jgi:hypothetical protein